MRQGLLILFVITAMVSCKKQRDLTEQEVIDTIKKFDNGWEHKNMKAVDSVLAPSYIYFTQSGTLFSRDSVVATSGENDYLLKNMSRSEIEVTITGNTAVVSTRWKGEGMYRGNPFNEDQRCSIVLMKKDNKVQFLSEHCTPIRLNRVFH